MTTPRLHPLAVARMELDNPPTRATLERTLIVTYLEESKPQRASRIAGLQSDPAIQTATRINTEYETLPTITAAPPPPVVERTATQYHLSQLRVPQSRQYVRGWALIGTADTGIATSHPDLTPSNGGNVLPKYSLDTSTKFSALCQPATNSPRPFICRWLADNDATDTDVDEAEPVTATPEGSLVYCSSSQGIDCISCITPESCVPAIYSCGQTFIPRDVGHGTHAAGLIAANASPVLGTPGIEGTCESCSLAVSKFVSHQCVTTPTPPVSFPVAVPLTIDFIQSFTWLLDAGSQIVSLSLGKATCQTPTDPLCAPLAYARSTETVVVAASGNDRKDIQPPAFYSNSVISVGGLNALGLFWDDYIPGQSLSCPNPFGIAFNPPNQDPEYFRECGSNFDANPSDLAKQEVVAGAKEVISLFYPGKAWNSATRCADSHYGAETDGVGACTGTSMSAPEVAGIVGLIRSANPLLRAGDPDTASSVRGVLTSTANKNVSGTYFAYHPQYGYGLPNAEAAVLRVLGGTSTANTVRITPVFTLRSSQDIAYFSSPQTATALTKYAFYSFSESDLPVLAYCLPLDFSSATSSCSAIPRANFYLYVSDRKVSTSHPSLRKVFAMDRDQPFRETLLAREDELSTFLSQGYASRGIVGYAATSSNASWGGEELFRKCRTVSGGSECAVFTTTQAASYHALGYIQHAPGTSDWLLGYAFHNRDTDGDSLIDGFEALLGTLINNADTDSDGCNDGREFPLAGVASRNPVSVESSTCPGLPFTPTDPTPGQATLSRHAYLDSPDRQCWGLGWTAPSSGLITRFELVEVQDNASIFTPKQFLTDEDLFQLFNVGIGGNASAWNRAFKVRACNQSACGAWSNTVYRDEFQDLCTL